MADKTLYYKDCSDEEHGIAFLSSLFRICHNFAGDDLHLNLHMMINSGGEQQDRVDVALPSTIDTPATHAALDAWQLRMIKHELPE